ncbi:NaeI family type II restriction endonuclease [Streptomyces sp. NPDC001009]
MPTSQPPLFGAPRYTPPDPQLEAVKASILKADPQGKKFGAALRRTFDMLLDGQHTGRFRWEQLHKTEKTHAGTLVEINLQRAFDFADGDKMDYSIEGIDVDCKYSQDIGRWMIPPEAMGHLCLGVWANDKAGIWSAGLFRVTDEALTKKEGNRDGKRSLTKVAREIAVHWLFWDAPLQDNILLRLSQEDIDAIFASPYGTQRVHELFRRTQGRIVSRGVVATVAQQDDYMKRVRYNGGSRSAMRPEGIVILGQYGSHQAVAKDLGLPEPGAGESISVRLTPWTPAHANERWTELEGTKWVLARDLDPKVVAPMLPER